MKRFILAAAIAISMTAFSASAVQVRPLYTEYAPSKKAGVLTIANTAKVEKTYQVSVDEWVLEGGKKVRKPATTLRFVPSLFTVKPGTVQTVRWVHNGSKPGEQAYRIKVNEVPDKSLSQMAGVLMLIHVDFPWFWRPDGLAPKLAARWDGPALVVTNSGNATAQLVDLVAGSVSKNGLVGYVLPGEEARFDIGAKGKVAVSVKVNGKATTLESQ